MAEKVSYIAPIVEYGDLPEDPSYVIVRAEIPGIIKTTCCRNFVNAKIEFSVTDVSFLLIVRMLEDTKSYKLEVKKLPRKIITDETKTYFKVNKDEVEIHLHKAVAEPWSQFLSSVGLDHYCEDS